MKKTKKTKGPVGNGFKKQKSGGGSVAVGDGRARNRDSAAAD